MNNIRSKDEEEIVVTLLSNGSSNLFSDNSITLFSNKLHTPINLNPSNYNYVALQEIGISLNSSNIQIPNEKQLSFILNGIKLSSMNQRT